MAIESGEEIVIEPGDENSGGVQDTSSEWYRHECECRYWLKVTGGDLAKVNDAMEGIAKKRGKAAADRLRGGMRAEWVKRRGDP